MSDNVDEIESPFDENEEQSKSDLDRNKLKKLTNKELAKLAKPKSRFQLSTLEGKSKDYLIDIILDISDEKEKESTARTSRTESESDEYINTAIGILEALKQQRENSQEAQINPVVKQIFKDSAVSKVDDARASGAVESKTVKNIMLFGSGAILLVDGLVGLNNVPELFSKLKEKVQKKRGTNEN
jgi:hypothetical protein